MRFLCIFFPHKWVHVFNVYRYWIGGGDAIGIYQCPRCKEISRGMARQTKQDLKRYDEEVKSTEELKHIINPFLKGSKPKCREGYD